jgi:CRISPR/Cas system CSM-associated protein Csm2 small subunit
VINDNGLRLLSFASSNSLVVGNSHFQHPLKHQLTWRHPSGHDSAMLDYILISSRFRSSLKDVRAMRGPDCGTDHYLVRAKLQLRLKRAKPKASPPAKPNWACLRDPALRQEFQIALSNKFSTLEPSDDVDTEEKQLSESILECAAPLCPPIRRRTQPWISDECLDLVEKRKRVKHVDLEQYRRLNKEVRQRMKAEREAYWNSVAADLEEAASRHEYRTLYQTLRRLSGKTKSTNDNIKKVDGTFVSSHDERLQRWKEFFQQLYNHDPPQGPPPEPPPIDPPEDPSLDGEPTVNEVESAIRSLKNGKTPGMDRVTAETIKAGGVVLLQRLHALLTLIWRSERVPSAWKKAIIVPILKKGDSRECKNYRGISLLSIVGKVFMKIIQSRLQKHREQTSREEQAGFRPHRGCTDQIFAIRQLAEERIRCGKRTVIVFIDFKSAFDCVHRPALWRTLESEHVPQKIIQLLQASYNGSTSSVRIRNELSEEFPIQTGVRQGDVASPLLFNIVIDAIMRETFENRRGVQYDVNNFLTDLMFADDSAIFADTDAEATDILYHIARIAQSYGLRINADKTKVMTTDGSQAIVHLDGVQIEHVQEFKYLGSLVQEKKVATTIEVHSRIGQAAAAFASLKWCLWKKANISTKTKIRLFRTLILPILLYGSETWTLLKPDMNKLEVFQMRCLRQILGVSLRDRYRNETIRMRCDHQPPVEEQIQKSRLRWFGHVCRMNTSRLPHKLLWRKRPVHWRIQRAAPKKTWLKHIEEDLRNQRLTTDEARNIATNRQEWQRIVNERRNPAAPTAAYWLRGRPAPQSPAKD